jgi:hypothetical protein
LCGGGERKRAAKNSQNETKKERKEFCDITGVRERMKGKEGREKLLCVHVFVFLP